MRTRSRLVITILVSSLIVLVASAGSRTAAKGRSSLTYEVHHALHEVKATSQDIQCTITVDDATHVITKADFSADVTTFDSGNSNRDSHAMEVLDALTYPTVSFESTTIVAEGDRLNVSGNLTFHGRTKPITFVASERSDAGDLIVDGATRVSLTAFDVERPSLLMIPVSDSLAISFTVTFPEPQ